MVSTFEQKTEMCFMRGMIQFSAKRISTFDVIYLEAIWFFSSVGSFLLWTVSYKHKVNNFFLCSFYLEKCVISVSVDKIRS